MSVHCSIKVLELWFQVNSSVLYSCPILLKNIPELLFFFSCPFEILSSCCKGIFLGNGFYWSYWVFVDTFLCEGRVNCVTEAEVVKHVFRCFSFIFLRQSLEFGICKLEIEHWKYTLELVNSNLSLSELIEISEELFNSDSLHNNESLESLLNVSWIICNVNCWQWEPIFEDFDVFGRGKIESFRETSID